MIETHLKNIEATIAAIRSELPKPKPSLPNVIPIVDCLWPDAMMKDDQPTTYYGNAYDGLLKWRGVVDSAIVVTKPGNDVYDSLADDFGPGFDIIPGYKSVDMVMHAFDWDGWLKFFVAIATFVNERKPPRMLVDIEATIKDYVLGGGFTNSRVIEQFAAMLHTLPCEFWIYPPPYWPGRDAGCQERLRLIVKALDGDNVRFISQRYQSPAAVKDSRFAQADQWAFDNLTKKDTFPEQVFFDGSDDYWTDDRFIECLQLIEGQTGAETEVLVYPGHARFVEASRVLAGILKEAKA